MIFNEEDYFCWLTGFIPDSNRYYLLANALYRKEFVYIFVMDGNRAEDGIELRSRFEREFEYEPGLVTGYFGNRPCSMLEMIVALALRCEESIMFDEEYGDRTGFWIKSMLGCLGLGFYTDDFFDEDEVENILDTFINRQYHPNGYGSLFSFRRDDIDVRTMEIWTQMNWWLNEYY